MTNRLKGVLAGVALVAFLVYRAWAFLHIADTEVHNHRVSKANTMVEQFNNYENSPDVQAKLNQVENDLQAIRGASDGYSKHTVAKKDFASTVTVVGHDVCANTQHIAAGELQILSNDSWPAEVDGERKTLIQDDVDLTATVTQCLKTNNVNRILKQLNAFIELGKKQNADFDSFNVQLKTL